MYIYSGDSDVESIAESQADDSHRGLGSQLSSDDSNDESIVGGHVWSSDSDDILPVQYYNEDCNPPVYKFTKQECIVEHMPRVHFKFNSDVLLVWKSFIKHGNKKGGKRIIQ